MCNVKCVMSNMKLHQQIVENVVLFDNYNAPVVATDFGQNHSPGDGPVDSYSSPFCNWEPGGNNMCKTSQGG